MAIATARGICRYGCRGILRLNPKVLSPSTQRHESNAFSHGFHTKGHREYGGLVQSKADACNTIFKMFLNHTHEMSIPALQAALSRYGILWKTDPRLASFRKEIEILKKERRHSDFHPDYCNQEELQRLLGNPRCFAIISKALSRQCIIPDFARFSEKIKTIFDYIKPDQSGKLANYIPQLAKEDPRRFGMALCTVDGQRIEIGDANVPFCMQSCIKPFQYAVAISNHTSQLVHDRVGKEPSGHMFNEIKLNDKEQPHNPMINAGALVICSLLNPELPLADRFVHVQNIVSVMAANEYTSFHNAVFQSEKVTAFRNFALAYLLMEKNVGLPAKSGVAGGLMLVVPNVMGVMIWSPLLDERGNSVRGLRFCQELVRAFNFHVYDNLRYSESKIDPRLSATPLTDDEEELRAASIPYWASEIVD